MLEETTQAIEEELNSKVLAPIKDLQKSGSNLSMKIDKLNELKMQVEDYKND